MAPVQRPPRGELRSIYDSKTCVRKGHCPVTAIRGQKHNPAESHELYFEQHGSGPEKIVFVMGLNSSSFAWETQVSYFAHQPEYSYVIFDNRGVGHSDVPVGPYSTSGMANDVITLLDYLGWTDKRGVHLVGISLGGMISMEIATRIPDRIASLVLAVTTPGGMPWNNFAPLSGTMGLAKATFEKDVAKKIPILLNMVYPMRWLAEPAEDDPQGRTNRAVQTEVYARRIEFTKPQTLVGALSQMCAALTHNVSPARLARISREIPKVTIVCGDDDNLVATSNSRKIKASMPEAELLEWRDTGHGIHAQKKKEFNALVVRTIKEGREKGGPAVPITA